MLVEVPSQSTLACEIPMYSHVLSMHLECACAFKYIKYIFFAICYSFGLHRLHLVRGYLQCFGFSTDF